MGSLNERYIFCCLKCEVNSTENKLILLQCTCMQLVCVCVRMRILVRCLAGGGTKVAIVIAILENVGLAGNSCCSRLARAGEQVLKVAAGPEIVTLATVLVVAVSIDS